MTFSVPPTVPELMTFQEGSMVLAVDGIRTALIGVF